MRAYIDTIRKTTDRDNLKVGDAINLRALAERILGATALDAKWEVVAIDGADLSVREVGKRTGTTQWLPRSCVASLA